ncbi:putative type I restriction enzyme specificity protein [Actinobacillus pleuropneumoniae serovar 8]|uniref:restriction endonuclease subunit S n=1 Tax=Actinobacillus pleuropneumoniae TaxID=715 RepID=UPI0005846E21|nr:restriction endonuclease subunit S [Actinobacillus pleuropneumoniae]KIE99608.1 putative type I restriction endonuclease EcoR124II subunit S [Actinobacillus pleuropneumoniae]CUU51608.1 putative type I restriction enzyme specificity protein [Actinobacillus pleuropneumoniae serovar 8]
MNILELIKDCEVEWKSLGEVFDLRNGYTPSKSNAEYWENGEISWFRMEDIRTNGRVLNEAIQKVSKSAVKGGKLFPANSIMLSTTATIGEHALITIPYLSNQQLTNFSLKEEFSEKLNIKYAFYYFFLINEDLKNMGSDTSLPIVGIKKLEKIQIPIPPLEIQEKIVKTLDIFTKLEATLESELSLRVKQYNYYRDLLLNENDKNPFFKNTEYRCLGDITLASSNIKWKNNTNTYKYIDLTSVDRENHSIGETIEISALTAPSRAQKLVAKDDVIFATTRPTQLRFAFINEEFANSIASTGYCVLRAKPNLVLPKWVYHNLGSIDFKNFLEENQSGSAYPAVSDSKVKDYKIPVPSLDVQEKIIAILDNFENLANSIKNGLPREIELRRKQYEYYRSELLDFSR